MHFEVEEDLLIHLREVCHAGRVSAERLVVRTRSRELRELLVERARQYDQAEQELKARLPDWPNIGCDELGTASELVTSDREIALQWELTECSALIHFRDAYDSSLPSEIRQTVQRHLEEGVSSLERLRAFIMRQWSAVDRHGTTGPTVR